MNVSALWKNIQSNTRCTTHQFAGIIIFFFFFLIHTLLIKLSIILEVEVAPYIIVADLSSQVNETNSFKCFWKKEPSAEFDIPGFLKQLQQSRLVSDSFEPNPSCLPVLGLLHTQRN